MRKVLFSVIIPYYNKSYELDLLLEALRMQTIKSEKFEVIIVNDGSEIINQRILEENESKLNIGIIKLKKHTGNRSFVRNMGVKYANGERIIFLDSDMIPEHDLIEMFDNDTKNSKLTIALGCRTNLVPFDKKLIDRKVVKEYFEIFRNYPGSNDERTATLTFEKDKKKSFIGNWQLFYSHSFCMWKDVFDEVGGFDERFSKNWGAEDIELGYRLYEKGCKIKLNTKIMSYHIAHDNDVKKNINSLKLNYRILLKKHPNWLIELFTREFEMWPAETILLQEKIREKEYIVNKLDDCLKEEMKKYKKILLVGVEDYTVLKWNNVYASFVPIPSEPCDKIKPIIGIQTEYKSEYFDLAVISGIYSKVNYGIGILLEREIKRISKKVIVTNKTQSKTQQSGRKREKNVLFTVANNSNMRYTNYYYCNLANALSKRNINVGLQYSYDPMLKIDMNIGYLKFKDEVFNSNIKKLRKHQLNSIGDEIPCFMDSQCCTHISRSINTRIFWETINYENCEKEIKDNIEYYYNKVFFQRKLEKNKLNISKDGGYLPLGVDRIKIESNFIKNKPKNEKIVFMWTDKLTNKQSNIEILLKVYEKLFKGNKRVELRVVTSHNHFPFIDNPYLNESNRCLSINYIKHLKYSVDGMLNELIQEYKHCENIKFINGVIDYEDYLEELSNATCIINLNGELEIAPLVLDSVCMGKKPIILNNNVYNEYINSNEAQYVNCKQISGAFYEDSIESAIETVKDNRRYMLLYQPLEIELEKVLRNVAEDRSCTNIEENKRKVFAEKYDWNEIACMCDGLL